MKRDRHLISDSSIILTGNSPPTTSDSLIYNFTCYWSCPYFCVRPGARDVFDQIFRFDVGDVVNRGLPVLNQ